jgi:hypothetical protein
LPAMSILSMTKSTIKGLKSVTLIIERSQQQLPNPA